MELVEGDDESMRRIERALRAAGALDADERPKLFQALGLVHGEPRRPKRKAPAIDHLVAMLDRQYREVLVQTPAPGWAPTRRICISTASPSGACARCCGRPGRCSTPDGWTSCETSCEWPVAHSAKCATWTS